MGALEYLAQRNAPDEFIYPSLPVNMRNTEGKKRKKKHKGLCLFFLLLLYKLFGRESWKLRWLGKKSFETEAKLRRVGEA